MISPDIKPNPTTPGTYGIACSKLASFPAVIDFTFTDAATNKPFNLTLPSSELSLGPFKHDPSLCQTVFNSFAFTFPAVIGGSLLKHYYSVWHSGNDSLGFAPIDVATTVKTGEGEGQLGSALELGSRADARHN
jgi:hypothetical protein